MRTPNATQKCLWRLRDGRDTMDAEMSRGRSGRGRRTDLVLIALRMELLDVFFEHEHTLAPRVGARWRGMRVPFLAGACAAGAGAGWGKRRLEIEDVCFGGGWVRAGSFRWKSRSYDADRGQIGVMACVGVRRGPVRGRER